MVGGQNPPTRDLEALSVGLPGKPASYGNLDIDSNTRMGNTETWRVTRANHHLSFVKRLSAMLVETENLVPADKFRKQLDKYVAAAREGNGPVAVTQNSEVVGLFISPQEYEAMSGVAVRDLLASRSRGPSVSQEEARARVEATIEGAIRRQ